MPANAAPWISGPTDHPGHRPRRIPNGTLRPFATGTIRPADYDYRPVTHYIEEIERLISRASFGRARLEAGLRNRPKSADHDDTAGELEGGAHAEAAQTEANPIDARVFLIARDLYIAFEMIYGAGVRDASARARFIKAATRVIIGENIAENAIKGRRRDYAKWCRAGMLILRARDPEKRRTDDDLRRAASGMADAAFMVCRAHEQAAYVAAATRADGDYREPPSP